MSEFSIWLYPLAISALVSLVIYLRNGLYWTWGGCLQQGLILACAVIGLTSGHYDIAAKVGWSLFVLFNVLQRLLIVRLNSDLVFLRLQAAMSKAAIVRLLSWGLPGAFWQDMCLLVAAFSRQDLDAAENILDKWRQVKMPQAGREYLASFEMLGRVIVRDWESIVREFEVSQQLPANPNSGQSILLYQMASRAYGELGRFDESVQCLELANLPAARLTQSTLDTQFMIVFSMCGAVEDLNKLLSRQAKGPNALPEYARLFWLGRCLTASGDYDEALAAFEKCRKQTPESLTAWHDRLNWQMARLLDRQAAAASGQSEAVCLASPDVVARARRILEKTGRIIELVRPEKTRPGVLVLSALIVFVYAVTNIFYLLNAPELEDLKLILKDFYILAYSLGVLEGSRVWAGEWWRLLSYLFLHANLSHLALNIFALLWFGKLVENMYGTPRFLIIYFGSGVLSGVCQILLSPTELAVGASGAIMGVFGAAAAGMIRLKTVLPANIRKMELTWMGGLAAAQILLDQIINFFGRTAKNRGGMPHIAAYAHMGGMLAGFLIGLALSPAASKPSLDDDDQKP